MITCSCIVQAGQTPDLHKHEMLAALNEFTINSFGERADVAWIPVAQGDGFTAGRSSTSSVVSLVANEKLTPTHREELLRKFVAMWMQKTRCDMDELVAVIADPA